MSRVIPNTGEVGNDYCLDSVLFEIPFIIVENGSDCFWFHQTMDNSTAERMAFAMTYGASSETYRIDVKLILPSASVVRATTAELDRLQCDPIRVKLLVD